MADRTTELGYPISRSAIANAESGRKKALDITEVIILANALDVSPLKLINPACSTPKWKSPRGCMGGHRTRPDGHLAIYVDRRIYQGKPTIRMVRLRESLSSPSEAFERLIEVTPVPVVRVNQQIAARSRTGTMSRQQRRLNSEQIESLVRDYRNGATASDLATTYGIHRQTVTKHIERSGGRTRSLRSFEGARLERLIAEYQAGLSTESLGRQYGVAGSTIARTLRRNGIQLR